MTSADSHASQSEPPVQTVRREFLGTTTALMACGLIGGYGTLGSFAGRFLYSDAENTAWLFVATMDQFLKEGSMLFVTPGGARVVVARQGHGEEAEAFIALSSVCPHLGCQVHWEPQNSQFFCPCHNGAFDPIGKAISGPPKAANQSLKQFPLRVEKGLLFIQVPIESVGGNEGIA